MRSCCPVSMRHWYCRLEGKSLHYCTVLVKTLTVATVHHVLVIGLLEMRIGCAIPRPGAWVKN